MLRGATAPAAPPQLDGPARGVYRRHLTFAVADAVAGGILANAPVVALKALAADARLLALPLFVSSAGMLLAPWLAERMAPRKKVWFVAGPAALYGACAAALAAVGEPLAFLLLVGLCNLFEVVSRPALAVVAREAYPVSQRGAACGAIRRWCAAVFLGTNLLAAAALDQFDTGTVVVVEFLLAGVACLVGAAAFRGVRLAAPLAVPTRALGFGEALRVVRSDARFRRYLVGCFLFGFFGLLYVSFIPAFMARTMGFGYLTAAVLVHVLPSVVSVLTTGALGRWFDRTKPLVAWQAVRVGWGLDPFLLVAAPFAAAVWAPAGVLLCAAGRVCRGSVMGGSWVLWWQIGVNDFAAPGADTGRYMAVLTGLNGVMRLAASAAGAALLTGLSASDVFVIGGAGVLLSALHARWQAAADRRLTGFDTFADCESDVPAGVR